VTYHDNNQYKAGSLKV